MTLQKTVYGGILTVDNRELATIVNCLEAAALHFVEGSDEQLAADDLVLQITRVMGY